MLFQGGEQVPGGQVRLGLKEETNAGRGYPPSSDLGVECIADKFSNHVHGSPCTPCTNTAQQVFAQCTPLSVKEKRGRKRKEKRAHSGTSRLRGWMARGKNPTQYSVNL
ncbi:hypothetical protein L873DRAFT_1673194 [Choiromyces venosus 120613-1]|uniref:Uncharacterized protein n=1 Tax=Choiromyces venosus 120613-1 TaxID=1336337 RepID=A0A3N4JZM9_9PEZI|nr:hypothetical protein L873DRAFT_1673194 [Choiromyces venosus 120613-1]